MGHVPHLYLPGPWRGGELLVDDAARHHIERVFRKKSGTDVSYTDGAGCSGQGRYTDGHVVRGHELRIPEPKPRITMAVSPPKSTERQRFIVEKLAELGVAGLIWLRTVRTEGRPVRADKAAAWAVSALEQSRGAHLLSIEGPTAIDALHGLVLVADPAGEGAWWPTGDATIVIGPEGGLAEDETMASPKVVSLGERTLRTETAALVAATLALSSSV